MQKLINAVLGPAKMFCSEKMLYLKMIIHTVELMLEEVTYVASAVIKKKKILLVTVMLSIGQRDQDSTLSLNMPVMKVNS